MRKFCSHCMEEMDTKLPRCPDCGKELFPIGQDSLVGTTIDDRYAVLEPLGRGGMGVVYRARQKYLEREVALKVLRKDTAEQEGAVKRFMLEARAASGLKSPHTVTIHDFGVTKDGLLYFTMELQDGRPLGKVIRDEGPLHYERAVDFAVQVCRSLAEAHEKRIWHRDLKPENLFIVKTPEGKEQVRVLDFGIAKFGGSSEKLTATGVVCGTPQYLSPEQAQGREVDGRSDVYSLAIVLYEMLAGQPPFVCLTPVQILLKHINDAPPPVQETNPKVDVPDAVNRVLLWALEKDPKQRPPSAEVFGRALKEAVQVHRKRPRTATMSPLVTSTTGIREVAPGTGAADHDRTLGDLARLTQLPTDEAVEDEVGNLLDQWPDGEPPISDAARAALEAEETETVPPDAVEQPTALVERKHRRMYPAALAGGSLLAICFIVLAVWQPWLGSDSRGQPESDPPVLSPVEGSPGTSSQLPASQEAAPKAADRGANPEAEAEAERKAETEARAKAEAVATAEAEAEAKEKAEAEAVKLAEAEARAKAEAEAVKLAEAEAKAKAEAEAVKLAETEAKAKAEAEAVKLAEAEAKAKAEAEAEARKKAEAKAEARKKAAEKKKAEEKAEARKKAEEEKKADDDDFVTIPEG